MTFFFYPTSDLSVFHRYFIQIVIESEKYKRVVGNERGYSLNITLSIRFSVRGIYTVVCITCLWFLVSLLRLWCSVFIGNWKRALPSILPTLSLGFRSILLLRLKIGLKNNVCMINFEFESKIQCQFFLFSVILLYF